MFLSRLSKCCDLCDRNVIKLSSTCFCASQLSFTYCFPKAAFLLLLPCSPVETPFFKSSGLRSPVTSLGYPFYTSTTLRCVLSIPLPLRTLGISCLGHYTMRLTLLPACILTFFHLMLTQPRHVNFPKLPISYCLIQV